MLAHSLFQKTQPYPTGQQILDFKGEELCIELGRQLVLRQVEGKETMIQIVRRKERDEEFIA